MGNLKNTTDARLTYLVRAGIKDAFRELFERYAPKIYRFALSYLKNGQDAEELVQDVFLKIWEKRETLDSSKNIKAFVYKVTVNAIYDFIRRRNLENAFKDFARENYDTRAGSILHPLIYDEMLAHLDELVGQMPGERQKIFRLSREEGLTNGEIAHKLNLSKRTVENQLYRALSFLKIHFKKDLLFVLLFFCLWHRQPEGWL